ncbi:MAG: response regulator [Oscillatoria sp. PMC 1051.18]|uniref:response regulator n=1 Tax=Oscillatoria salina TaxID=331517 RepID=UPI0013BB69D3|nr:response regulator [Oscillatoria salina]MBZ8180343.1 response regulator [Oscillatoria salina IIICB1]MEC4892337.1 response regulator [Oscillatoria sp. PMC 1050.18]MEC5029092.1 response regulator [Oscillatoria sp. PMC 1051.18]NET88625.1 response regulator [Kamptonema sp. SIO1D9]
MSSQVMFPSNSVASPTLSGLRILIVDGDEDTRNLFALFLQLQGAEVIAVDSVSEALNTLTHFSANILLSELMIPYEDGYSLISQIRNHQLEHIYQVPVIAVTVAARQEDRQLALAKGFNAHISKPVDLDDLCFLINQLSQY